MPEDLHIADYGLDPHTQVVDVEARPISTAPPN
jgi:hypothetical protein